MKKQIKEAVEFHYEHSQTISDFKAKIIDMIDSLPSLRSKPETDPIRYFFFPIKWHTKKKSGYGNLCMGAEKFPSQFEIRAAAMDVFKFDKDAELIIRGFQEFSSREDFMNFLGMEDEQQLQRAVHNSNMEVVN